MRLALGVTVHTGWAACIVAGGSLDEPHVAARAELEILGDAERFVFHRAAQMARADVEAWIARAMREATARTAEGLRGVIEDRRVVACGVVAKAGAIPALDVVLSAHLRIHAAEGLFYRDALVAAAHSCGLEVRLVAPSSLDAKDARLAAAGRAAGKPWDQDWKQAALAAWAALGSAT
jgi:hypothetical protein